MPEPPAPMPKNAPVRTWQSVAGPPGNEYVVTVFEFKGKINTYDVRQLLEAQPQGQKQSHLDKPCCLIFTGTHGDKDGLHVLNDETLDAPEFGDADKETAKEKNKDLTFPYNVRTHDLGAENNISPKAALDRWKPTVVVLAFCHSYRSDLCHDIDEHVNDQARILARQIQIK
eukprot:s777_g38.t1